MSRKHIFELEGTEGSVCVCVVWENNKEELRWERSGS